jgi:hypothetical protein
MNLEKAKEILSKPISPEEIEWRPKGLNKDKNKLLVLPYIDNRCVMNRFDEAFGWENWSSETIVIEGTYDKVKDRYGNEKTVSIQRGFATTIRVNTPEGMVSKTDVGENSDIEPLKGGFSDSMKRCAVQFGLGRGLYDYPTVYIENTTLYIPNWAYAKLDGVVNWINEGKKDRDMLILKQ